MDNILTAIKGEKPPGLYRLSPEIKVDELFTLCRLHDCQLFYIDGRTVTNKEEFLQAGAKAIKFPDYFGNNWDAFEDCLIDLNWCQGKLYIILYTYPENFAQNSPPEWSTAIEILEAAVDYWQDTDTPLYVVFKTDSPILNNLTIL